MEVKTMVQREEQSLDENHIIDNPSQSIASSISSEGKDFYSNVKDRIKSNIKVHKSVLHKLKIMFMLAAFAYLAVGVVNTYFQSLLPSFVFSPQYLGFIYTFQSGYGRLFGMSYLLNLINLSKVNPDLIIPGFNKNATIMNFKNTSQTEFLSKMMNYTQKFSASVDKSNETPVTIFRIADNFDFGSGLNMTIKSINYIRETCLQMMTGDPALQTIPDFDKTLNKNFAVFYKKAFLFSKAFESDFNKGQQNYQLFQMYTTIIA